MAFWDAMVGWFLYHAALVLVLTPCSWAGFAMATIHGTNFARLGLGLSFVLPYYLVLWCIFDFLKHQFHDQAFLPLPLLCCCFCGLCSFASWSTSAREALWGFWTCGLFDMCFGYHQGFCAMSSAMVAFGWIGSVLAPFLFVIHERGIPDDIAKARSWLLPGLARGGTSADAWEASQEPWLRGVRLETHTITIPADAFPSSGPRPVGSVVLEVRNLIKPRRRQVDTLVSLLRLRFPDLPVEAVSGERSFARIRVSFEHEAVAVASIKAIAKESSKNIDVREVPGTRLFNSPRD